MRTKKIASFCCTIHLKSDIRNNSNSMISFDKGSSPEESSVEVKPNKMILRTHNKSSYYCPIIASEFV